jgi:hypothetical protein
VQCGAERSALPVPPELLRQPDGRVIPLSIEIFVKNTGEYGVRMVDSICLCTTRCMPEHFMETPVKDPIRFTRLISELMVAEWESLVGKE